MTSAAPSFKDKYSFNNVEGFKGGAGDSTLIGSNDSVNAFYGGSGNTTILSGAGADTLHGYEDSDKTGSTKFMYFGGQGRDSIVSFNFGTDNTSDEVLAIGGVDEVRVVGDDLRIFATGDDEDYLTVAEASGEIVKVNAAGQKYTLSLGTNAKYSKDGDFFGNVDTKDNTLTIGSDVTEPVKVMLAGNEGKFWNITKIDATNYAGNATLIGSAGQDNEITGGSGNNTLWGGIGNDTLVGGSGKNMFFYFADFDGDDVIRNAHGGDIIQIVGSLADLDGSSFNNCSAGGINLRMNSGGTLNITGTDLDQVTVRVGNTSWQVNPTGTGFHRA